MSIARYYRLFSLFVFVGMAVLLLSPLGWDQSVPRVTDYLHHLAAIADARLAIADGQFPLRIAPTMHEGWSYPFFQFYSSTSYTIAGIIHLLLTPSNPWYAFKITIGIALIIGAIFMQCLAYEFFHSKSAALLASVIYLSTPYFIIIINHIGAFNEVIALGILPAVLYYTVKRYHEPKKIRWLLIMALVWYLLATIHLITFIYSSLFIFLLLFLRTLQNRKAWINLIDTGIAYVFGCLLAIWYLGPIAVMAKYLYISDALQTLQSLFRRSVTIVDLFSTLPVIPRGMAFLGLSDSILRIHPNIGLPMLLASGVAFYAYFSKKLSKNAVANTWLPLLLILFSIVFFMIWMPATLWSWLPSYFRVIEYSWRLLGQMMWIGALLFAWFVIWFGGQEISTKFKIIIIMLIISFSALPWLIVGEDKFRDFSKPLKNTIDLRKYVINGIKHRSQIKVMDSILLNSYLENPTLALDTVDFVMLPKILNQAFNPYLSLQGTIPKKTPPLDIIAKVDNQIISRFSLKPGLFQWNIPLQSFKEKKPQVLVQILMEQKQSLKEHIPLNAIIFGGILNAEKVLDAQQTKKHCVQTASITCQIDVPIQTHIVELPVFYYPDMIDITVNGVQTAYFSVFYQQNLISAIIPDMGRWNTIHIKFRGLLWANYISLLFLGLWLLFCLYCILASLRARD